MCLPARYGCVGSSVSRNGSGRSGRSEDLRRGRLALPPGSAALLCRAVSDTCLRYVCRLVDRYILNLGDEVEHGALGATAEAIEDLALEMDRAGWPSCPGERDSTPCASLRRRGSLRRSGRGSARRMLLLHASEIQSPRGHDVKYPLRTSPAIAAMRGSRPGRVMATSSTGGSRASRWRSQLSARR